MMILVDSPFLSAGCRLEELLTASTCRRGITERGGRCSVAKFTTSYDSCWAYTHSRRFWFWGPPKKNRGLSFQ